MALALLAQCSDAKNPAESNTPKQKSYIANDSAKYVQTATTKKAETTNEDFATVSNSEDQKRIETTRRLRASSLPWHASLRECLMWQRLLRTTL